MSKKKGVDVQAQQEKLQRSAEKHVVQWRELQSDDYDFGSWAGSKELLVAGCVYEYARESRRLRCLLALSRGSFPDLQSLLSCSFEGLRYEDVLLMLGGWFGWLRSFADQLADNKSFAALHGANEASLRKSIDTLPKYFLAPKAVELALPPLIEPRLSYHRQPLGELGTGQNVPYRPIRNYGWQNVAIQIRWRDFTDEEIGKEMEELAGRLRPFTEPEPERRGKNKLSDSQSLLDALAAMRLASHWRKRDAIVRFSDVQLGHIGRAGDANVALTNFNKLIEKARRFFAGMFPFGENAVNAVGFSERQR